MANEKILIADDEARMRKLVGDFLKKEGYTVLEAANGEEALDIFYQNKDIALLILDVMMPKYNGYEVLKELREVSTVPVIMLTAKAAEPDELKGFSLGVDEYVTKPFSPKILVARVGAVLRRGNPAGAECGTVSACGILCDTTSRTVTIDGQPAELSTKEFELLLYFIKNKGIALSRDTILNHVWSYDYFGDARTIDTHVKTLRSKLLDKSGCIKTVWGVGYKFEEA